MANADRMSPAIQRFYIYRIYLPMRRFSHVFRNASRGLRSALGLRKSAKTLQDDWRVRDVSWWQVCRSTGVAFKETDKADGNVSLAELAVLNGLVRTHQPRAIFEIGTFDGRTTLNLALNSEGDVHTLDLPASEAAKFGTFRGDKKYVDKPASGARFTSEPNASLPCTRRITQHYGDSATFDYSAFEGRMEFVFVDGAHNYDYVVNDTEVALKLLRPAGGVIVWHDYGVWPDVARGLKEICARHPYLELVHVRDTTLVVSIIKR